MPRKLAAPTRLSAADRERLKERLKTLIYAGHNVRSASEMCGMEESTAQKWATRYGWRKEIKQVKALAPKSSEGVPTAANILFDLTQTNRQSRAALAQIANLTVMRKLKAVTEDEGHPGLLITDASDFAAVTKATAQIAGDWEDASANRFAVSLHLNQLVQGGQIKEIPPGVTVVVDD